MTKPTAGLGRNYCDLSLWRHGTPQPPAGKGTGGRVKNNHHRYQQADRQEINPADSPRGTGPLSPKAGLASGRVVNPGPALPWRSCRV